MTRPSQYRRLLALAALMAAGFVFLAVRLHVLQIDRHHELERKAEACFTFRRRIQATRGFIFDTRGRVLAMSVPVKTIYVDPCLLGDRPAEMARVLAPWLGIEPIALTHYLRRRFLRVDHFGETIYDNKVLLKRQATLDEWRQLQATLLRHDFGLNTNKLTHREKVQLNRLRTRAIYAEDDQVRRYPHGPLAAHVIGFVGRTNGADGLVGLSGIEAVYNSVLSGTSGYYVGERDARGVEVAHRRLACRAPVDGAHVYLTIDIGLQSIAEAELAGAVAKYGAEGGAVIALAPASGQVLAMVSAPGFDLENLHAVPADAWRNRAFDRYECGSVFKIVTYSAGLEENLISWPQLIDAEQGHYHPPGVTHAITDPGQHGRVPVLTGLVKSLNVVAAKIGLALGPERLHAYISRFGFGQATGVGLAEDKRGLVSPPKTWSRTTLSRVPLGYAVDVTPMQLVTAMGVIANSGLRMQPYLLARVVDNSGQVVTQGAPRCIERVLSPAVARHMATGLTAVVTSPHGTGKLAGSERFSIGGKTGTARRVWKDRRGYEPGKYRATFCGFLGIPTPQLCIIVYLDAPRGPVFGGSTAAPTFRHIAERAADYLALPPERPMPAGAEARTRTYAALDLNDD